jgi:hypothetical protein
MTEATLEKAVCDSCGADVREGTQFCYNCGQSVAPPAVEERKAEENGSGELAPSEPTTRTVDPEAILSESEPLSTAISPESEEAKSEVAVVKRRRARVKARKKKEIVWEPVDEGPSIILIAVTLAIVLISAVIVGLTVYWK